jgi:hypothetical protein
MARGCDCDKIMDMMQRDPRLRTLPAVARMLWLELVMAMRAAGTAVLRFGDQVPDADALAMMAAMAPSEIAANVERLVQRGLLSRDADGALGAPVLVAAATRSEINRANALAGVEKRRRARASPGQMELPVMGVVAGTAAKPSANGSETAGAPPGVSPLSLKLDSKDKLKAEVDDATFHRVGMAAFVAAGFDPARSVVNYGIARQWIADGATEETILRVITAKTHAGVSHLGYFTKAIMAATKAGASAPVWSAGDLAFERAYEEWVLCGRQGERPTLEQCRADAARAA